MDGQDQREGERQLEELGLDEKQEHEAEQAEKFTRLYGMGEQEAEEHLEGVAEEHERQQEEMAEEHERERQQGQ